MCELFGVCARQPVECRDDLKEFYRHSCRHPNGWGLAVLDGNSAAIEKEPLNRYVRRQIGETDSERIFLFLLDEVNRRTRLEGKLDAEKRFRLMDDLITDMAKGNKLNLIISDGEYMYVHTNQEHSLHFRKRAGQVAFSTEPLGMCGSLCR